MNRSGWAPVYCPAIVSRRSPWLTALTLLGLLAAFALRAHLLGDQDLWWDEGLAVWAVRQPFLQTTLWTAGDVHPPLYFWLLWPWIRLTGDTPFAMRFLTLAFGMLTVAAGGAAAHRLAGPRAAALAVWLLALSRFEVWWSQEMRMYMLAGALSLLALAATLRIVDRAGAGRFVWRDWGLYLLAATGALYTLYLSALNLLILSAVVAAVGLRQWMAGARRAAAGLLLRWLAVNLAAGVLLAPWLILAASRMKSWSVAQPVPFLLPFELFGVLLATGASTDLEQQVWAVAVAAVVCAAGATAAMWLARRARSAPAASAPVVLLALTLLLPPLAVYVLTQPGRAFYVPRLEARYFLPFAATVYVALAWALDGLWRWRRAAGLIGAVAVFAMFAWSLPQHYAGRHLSDGYPSMARALRAHARPGDAVVLVSGGRYPLFLYEYDRAGLGGLRAPVTQAPQFSAALTPDNVEAELGPLLDAHDRVWLALADPHMEDPDGLALPWLQARRAVSFDQRFNATRLMLFTPQPEVVDVPQANLAPQFALDNAGGRGPVGYDLPVQRIVPGESAYQAVYWAPGVTGSITYTWRHTGGKVVGVVDVDVDVDVDDSPPAFGYRRDIVPFPVYGATPAGDYALEMRGAGVSATLPGPRVAGTRPLPEAGARVDQLARVGEFELLGFALSPADGAVRRGGTLTLWLDWRLSQRADRRVTFFAHLLGSAFNPATSGPVWAGRDAEPLDGGLPATQWWTGEAIRDELRLEVPADAPAGEYQIEIGAYPTGDAQRLAVAGDGADEGNRRVLLNVVVSVAP